MSPCVFGKYIETLLWLLDLQAELVVFYKKHHFYFNKKRLTKTVVFGIHFLENKWSEAVASREQNKTHWQYLLAVIKLALLNKIRILKQSATVSLTAPQYLKTFFNEISGNNYRVWFLKKCCIVKCVYI